ncbi:UNVERIFIED_ORG: hypothetical protein FNL38_10155 [Nocardia globerula]|uniref:Uncharacterized protein n=1 Tax=Nocardia globerula TaxID=1818 RepID=A0A652YW30_NOCGL|nr:hypothetical protein C8E04_1257 [Rhodococcus globerulus]
MVRPRRHRQTQRRRERVFCVSIETRPHTVIGERLTYVGMMSSYLDVTKRTFASKAAVTKVWRKT